MTNHFKNVVNMNCYGYFSVSLSSICNENNNPNTNMRHHPLINYGVTDYCKIYNSFLINNGYPIGNSIQIPQMFVTPNFSDNSYMFDEIVDIRDENREHKIEIIRNMMRDVFE